MKTTEQLLADIGAHTGDKTKLAANATLPTDLVTAANTVATLTGENTALKSDKDKLTKDLATANAAVTTVTKERDEANAKVTKLEGEKKTVEEAVAAKLVELGISDGKKKGDEGKAGEAKLTKTQQCLKAKGLAITEKVDLAAGLVGGTVSAVEISE